MIHLIDNMVHQEHIKKYIVATDTMQVEFESIQEAVQLMATLDRYTFSIQLRNKI